ncbi:DNA adenine methylase [Rhodoferax sp. 4810]|uniref:site-specific DNA-methyltransferase (adenine-specific) n=1 Tax=Thiospirillum jenense TaxID=1653858 RepID=A0A839H5W9_9GAMM|nr:DNA adenine methylase [Thiospirillum jenense]MBB1074209.1 DNA adenine methylase [Rhodoferax jenense]MBB1125283.1 DNA adenine methylase [Thiospirillum jenense]
MRHHSTASLFNHFVPIIPETQGIKYAGSKLKLIPHILSLFDDLTVRTVLDGFSGTTRVSQAFAQLGLQVISNDISEWSYIFGVCYLKNRKPPAAYTALIDHLNAVPGYDGWFTTHYGGYDYAGNATQLDGNKKPWQIHNTRKIDGIRDEIDALGLPEIDRAVALTSLMLAMDEVDNTLGHFTSYLRQWSPRSYRSLQLKIPRVFINNQDNIVLKEDIFDTIQHAQVDFAYFDPPYGSNNEKMPPSRVRYAAYYHLWTTVCKHDKPAVFGAALRRQDSSDQLAPSVFEAFRSSETGQSIAVAAIENLIKTVTARYVALSYSSGGKANAVELDAILNRHGKRIKTMMVDYKKNVMADMKSTQAWLNAVDQPHREFIFLLDKHA